MSEMRVMFTDLKEKQDQKMDQIFSKVYVELPSTVKYDAFLDEIRDVKEAYKDNQNYIKALEVKLDKVEKSAHSIYQNFNKNIVVNTFKSKDRLLKNLRVLGQILNVSIQSRDVNDIFRIDSKDPNYNTRIYKLPHERADNTDVQKIQ